MPAPDNRSPSRKAMDEQIAAEPMLPAPAIPAGTKALPIESHLGCTHRPLAYAGVVENGLVRPLDPDVRLPERARVIIVAAR